MIDIYHLSKKLFHSKSSTFSLHNQNAFTEIKFMFIFFSNFIPTEKILNFFHPFEFPPHSNIPFHIHSWLIFNSFFWHQFECMCFTQKHISSSSPSLFLYRSLCSCFISLLCLCELRISNFH